MKKNLKASLLSLFLSMGFLAAPLTVNADMSIEHRDVTFSDIVVVNQKGKIYARVRNDAPDDLIGTVRFYDELTQEFISTDQVVSIISNTTDDVFVDWTPTVLGTHRIAVRVIPEDENDDPSNNKIVKEITVDIDSDGDGVPNLSDPDDDNDGVNDAQDAFPLDPSESQDTDGDGIGNNADTDDDNDGTNDVSDLFPTDPSESSDTDNDGVGDNADLWPRNALESSDADGDGVGDNADTDDENHGPILNVIVGGGGTHTTNTTGLPDYITTGAGDPVILDASPSKDPDGQITDITWSFESDGTTLTQPQLEQAFSEPGMYTVNLKVVDDSGEERTHSIQISVERSTWPLLLWLAIPVLVILILKLLKKEKDSRKPKKTTPKKGSK